MSLKAHKAALEQNWAVEELQRCGAALPTGAKIALAEANIWYHQDCFGHDPKDWPDDPVTEALVALQAKLEELYPDE